MLTPPFSSSSPYQFGGLSQQTLLENEKLAAAFSHFPFSFTSTDSVTSNIRLLRTHMHSHHEPLYHELESLERMLNEASLRMPHARRFPLPSSSSSTTILSSSSSSPSSAKQQRLLKLSVPRLNTLSSTTDPPRSVSSPFIQTEQVVPKAPTTQTRVFHPFLTQKKGKKLIPEKSVRKIQEELETKLQFYRMNPTHYEMFKLNMLNLKEEQKINRGADLVKYNIQNVSKFAPEAKKEAQIQKSLKTEERFENVKKARDVLQERMIKKQDYYLEQALKESTKHQTNSNEYNQRYKWVVLCSLASRLFYIQQLLQANHASFFLEKRHHYAARRIQQVWKQYKARQLEKQKRASLKVIGKVVRMYMIQKRESKKEVAANWIRDLFNEMNTMGKLHKIIKKFRYQVIQAQHYVRTFLSIRQAQFYLLQLQFCKYETDRFAELTSSSLSDSSFKKSQRSSHSGKKKSEEKKSINFDIVYVPTEIREKVVFEALITKRKAFRKAVLEYDKKMELYCARHSSKSTNTLNEPIPSSFSSKDSLPPHRPLFHLLFSDTELKALRKTALEIYHNSIK